MPSLEELRNLMVLARGKGHAAKAEAIDSAIEILNEHLASPQPEDTCDCHAWSHPDWKGCPIHGRSGPQPEDRGGGDLQKLREWLETQDRTLSAQQAHNPDDAAIEEARHAYQSVLKRLPATQLHLSDERLSQITSNLEALPVDGDDYRRQLEVDIEALRRCAGGAVRLSDEDRESAKVLEGLVEKWVPLRDDEKARITAFLRKLASTPTQQGRKGSGVASGTRRWKLWRIDRGEDGEDWAGVEGPATNPPDDWGLTGVDWVKAATVEVVEACAYDALQQLANDLAKRIEAEEALLQALRDKAAPCSRCGGDGQELVDGLSAPCGDCEGTGIQIVIATDSAQQGQSQVATERVTLYRATAMNGEERRRGPWTTDQMAASRQGEEVDSEEFVPVAALRPTDGVTAADLCQGEPLEELAATCLAIHNHGFDGPGWQEISEADRAQFRDQARRLIRHGASKVFGAALSPSSQQGDEQKGGVDRG